jgi:hypothetical protein
MSLTLSISISDTATEFITSLERDVQPSREMNQSVAEQMLVEVKRTFQNMFDKEENVLKSTGFWMYMNSNTFPYSTDDAAMVSMPRPVAQRYFGGTITPKAGDWLTLPLRSEAVGVSARDFNDLRFVPIGNDRALLVQKDQTQISQGRKREDGTRKEVHTEVGGMAFYLLVKSVTQAGNSDILPSYEEFASAAKRGINYFLKLRHK